MISPVLRVNLTREELRTLRIMAAEADTPVPQLIARVVREGLRRIEGREVAARGDNTDR